MRKYSERSPASPSNTIDKNVTDSNNNNNISSASPYREALPLKKSTRDWSTPPSTNIQNLSLISRSSGSENIPSLKSVELQIELWNDICRKTSQVKNPSDTKQWASLVALFRKLREGIWASHWSEGNIRFAVKVYEESVHTSLRGQEFAEFRKAIRGLVDDLYILHEDGINGHYLALDVIYRACHLQQPQEAMNIIYRTELSGSPYHHGNEIKYAKQIVHALSTNNWVHFFRLTSTSTADLVILD
ncbi:hypothetical protein BCR42DRAFT_453622 [Absidia repens]|uniref:Uncharacterized protein n=1 Tax=Absidia repens TaxID=90262 RepID=A0A1X2I9J1_9FUNG|nr:hypothetical protein BCR42DRAFT_453622 [Absidia repens]